MLAQSVQLRCLLAVLLGASVLPATVAHAQNVSTDGKNSVLTVPVDGSLDAVFFYDDLTRELTGFVLNNDGVFNIGYKVSLEKFFTGPGGKSIKEPVFLFATGKVSIRTKGRLSFGGGAIYITESKTGQLVALALPWNAAYRNQRSPLVLEPRLIKKFALRNVDMDE